MFEFLDRTMLSMFANGRSSKQIAASVDRSVSTVNERLQLARHTAGVESRREMHAWLHAHPEVLLRGGYPLPDGPLPTVREMRAEKP